MVIDIKTTQESLYDLKLILNAAPTDPDENHEINWTHIDSSGNYYIHIRVKSIGSIPATHHDCWMVFCEKNKTFTGLYSRKLRDINGFRSRKDIERQVELLEKIESLHLTINKLTQK